MITRARTAARLSVLLAACAIGAACSGGDTASIGTDTVGSSPVESSPLATGPVETARVPSVVEQSAWAAVFADLGVVGTFAVREVGTDTTFVYDAERAAEPRLPASTFKIANSLVILETGVLPDVDAAVAWDGETRDVAAWNRDHSLRSGIEVSAVWMYQELARRVGAEAMAEQVAALGYGNADTSGDVDRFWLDGNLRISPLQQLDFLEGLVTGDLPVRPEVVEEVREIIVRETGDGYTWSHKTGTALADDPVLGWLVGSTRYDNRDYVFALNLDLGTIDDIATQLSPELRQDLARQLLESAGALPPR